MGDWPKRRGIREGRGVTCALASAATCCRGAEGAAVGRGVRWGREGCRGMKYWGHVQRAGCRARGWHQPEDGPEKRIVDEDVEPKVVDGSHTLRPGARSRRGSTRASARKGREAGLTRATAPSMARHPTSRHSRVQPDCSQSSSTAAPPRARPGSGESRQREERLRMEASGGSSARKQRMRQSASRSDSGSVQ